MGRIPNSFLKRTFAILAIGAVLVTGVKAPIFADEVAEFTEEQEVAPSPAEYCSVYGHDMENYGIIVAPTCVDPGLTLFHCNRCGYETDMTTPEELGHAKDEGIVVTNPTCTGNGKVQFRCSRCGTDMGVQDIPPLGHTSDAGTIVKQPTATAPGEKEFKCAICGTVLHVEIIPPIPKREMPQATFNTISAVLGNIPEHSTVKINGTVISNDASGSINLPHNFPNPGEYTITVVANGNDSVAESDAQSIRTQKPAAPSHIQTVDEPANGVNGYIGGVDTSMEYSLADQDTWITCTSSSQPVRAGIYIVRYRATDHSLASDAVEALVAKKREEKPATPNASFDGATHQLRGLSAGMVYSTNGGDTWNKASNAAVSFSADTVKQAISYKSILVKNIVNNVESDVQKVNIARVSQPVGVSTLPATAGNNGVIAGVGSDMQYRKDGSDAWIDIGSDKVSGLSKGKYFVRRKAYSYFVESNPIEVTVSDKASGNAEGKPSAVFNAYNMHIDGVTGCRLSFDGGKTWTDRINDWTYVINESYLNTQTGIIVYRQGNGSTTTDSEKQYITLIKQPVPSGITATSATATVPGAIIGTDNTMQYRISTQNNWVDVMSNTIPVAAGTYYLRRHGYANALPSDWLTIVIKAEANVSPTTPTKVVPVDNDKKIVVEKNTEATGDKKDVKPAGQEEKKEDSTQKTEEKAENPNKEEQTEATTSDDSQAANADGVVAVTGEKGWKAIEAVFENVSEPVEVTLNKETSIPAEVFTKAAETSTALVLTAGNNAIWSIAPEDVNINEVQALGNIDLGVDDNTDKIPSASLKSVEDDLSNQKIDHTFNIRHDGGFGFKAKLTVKVDSGNQGQYANLFLYNTFTDKMEYIDSAVINEKKEASFMMNHASSYAVVVSDKMLSQESVKEAVVSEKNEAVKTTESKEVNKKKASPVVAILIIIIFVLTIAVVVLVIMMQKKKDASNHKNVKRY